MKSKILLSLISVMIFVNLYSVAFSQERLMVFCGAAFKKPVDEIISIYEKKTGIKIDVTYGAVKTITSQLILAKEGDVLIVPSPDIMANLIEKNVILKDTIKEFSYQVPVMLVQKGNPKNIKGIKDLLREDLRLAIANPENVYVGMLATEILDKNFPKSEKDALRKKIVTYADDISRLLAYLIMNQVDVILGFDFLHGWEKDKTDMIKFKDDEIVRIGVGQAGVITYTKNIEKAKKFCEFLQSSEAIDILKKYGYLTTKKEVIDFVGKEVTVGGIPLVSGEWIKK